MTSSSKWEKTVLLAIQRLSKDSSRFKSPTSVFFGCLTNCFEMFGTNGTGFFCLFDRFWKFRVFYFSR